MNIAFISSLRVEEDNGRYYHHCLNDFINYYEGLGELKIATSQKSCVSKNKKEIEFKEKQFYPLTDENNLYARFCNRKNNKLVIENLVKESDFLITHLPSSVGSFAISMARKYKKQYLVVVVGCPWDAYWNHSLKGKLIAPFEFLLLKRLVSRAKYVIYVTQLFLQKRYPTKGRSIGCSNVRIEIEDNFYIQRVRKLGVDPKSLNIFTVAATDVRYKGQEYVIKAISKLKKAGHSHHYYLIGSGDQNYLKAVAEKYNVTENITFLGVLSKDEILLKLKECDLYIQPSKQEGLPRALVEAMSVGCPAIGSKIAGIPELLSRECLFRKGNVSQISNIISNLTLDKLIELSHSNYHKASEYQISILTKRRTEFLQKIKTEIDGKKVTDW